MTQNNDARRPGTCGRRSPYGMVIGIVLGLAIGVAVGAATGSWGVWIGSGMALGIAVGTAFTARPQRPADHEEH